MMEDDHDDYDEDDASAATPRHQELLLLTRLTRHFQLPVTADHDHRHGFCSAFILSCLLNVSLNLILFPIYSSLYISSVNQILSWLRGVRGFFLA